MAIPGNQTIGSQALLTIPLALLLSGLLHGVARDTLHGWHQSPLNLANHPTRCFGSWLHTVDWIKNGNQKVPETCIQIMALLQSFALAISFLVFANSETETCLEKLY